MCNWPNIFRFHNRRRAQVSREADDEETRQLAARDCVVFHWNDWRSSRTPAQKYNTVFDKFWWREKLEVGSPHEHVALRVSQLRCRFAEVQVLRCFLSVFESRNVQEILNQSRKRSMLFKNLVLQRIYSLHWQGPLRTFRKVNEVRVSRYESVKPEALSSDWSFTSDDDVEMTSCFRGVIPWLQSYLH